MPTINEFQPTESRFQENDRSLIQQIGLGHQKAFGILYEGKWHHTQHLQKGIAVELQILKMKGTHRAPKRDGTFIISQNRKKVCW
jgi:hypothetical protein